MRNIDTKDNQKIAIRVFHLFLDTIHSVVRETDRRFQKAVGISTTKLSVLMVLSANGGAVTSAKLAEQTNTMPHNITTLVDRMKKDGLVTKKRDKVDRRLVRIKITDKGQSVLDKALPIAREIIARITASTSEQDLAASEKVLTIVKQNISSYR